MVGRHVAQRAAPPSPSLPQGVPCVQAVGEGEATCAALNVAGWATAAHTSDVDALLFGARTVYRQLHLQVGPRQPRWLPGSVGSSGSCSAKLHTSSHTARPQRGGGGRMEWGVGPA